MDIARHRGGARVVPILIVAMLLLTGSFATSWESPVAARQLSSSPALDLPAMVLTSAQLEAAGMPGYKVISGELTGPRSLARIAGEWTDQFLNDDIQASLESYGLLRAYGSDLRLQQEPADTPSDLLSDVIVSLHEFTDPTGASQALGYMDQLSAVYPDVQRVESTGPATASAVLVRPVKEDPSDAGLLEAAWQVDRLIVVVRIYDYQGGDPTAETAEAIAAVMAPRIQAGLAGDTPGLGNMALRMKEPQYQSIYETRVDEYWRIGSEDYRFAFDEPGEFDRRIAAAGNAIDVYAFNQFVDNIESVDPSLPYQFGWVTRLYQFADDQAASAWLAEQAGRLEASYAGTDVVVQDVQVIEGAPTAGEESVSVTYVTQGNISSRIIRTYLRVGNRTADIYLTSFADVPFPEATIHALGTVQAACLANGCPEPILITDAVAGKLPSATPGSGTAVPAAQEVDLASIALTPGDLATLQMPGYGVGFGQTTYPDAFIAATAVSRGLAEDQVRAQVEASGFVRRYDQQLYLPADPNAPAGAVGRMVAFYVLEFSDASGAASIFDFLEDESANALATDVTLSAPIGDRAEATREASTDPATGEAFEQIDLTFQWRNFQAGVAIIDWQGQNVQLADVESLARVLFGRLQIGYEANTAGLSGLALRLSGAAVEPYGDHYQLKAGKAIAQYGESAQDVDGRSAAAATIGQTDDYVVQQYLATGADVPDDDVWYTLHLMQFTDEAAAANWMAGVAGRVSGNTGFANAVMLDGPVVGEESVAYTLTSSDGSLGYRGISFRVGNQVATIDLSSSAGTNPLLLLALADGQATCLEVGGCTAPLSVAPGLL